MFKTKYIINRIIKSTTDASYYATLFLIGDTMLTHENLWTAIDTLARMNGFSTSGLAKKAGLDPTIFNKSKRISVDGRLHWPTTESIAKILGVNNSSFGQFASIIHNKAGQGDYINLPQAKLSGLQGKASFINPNGHIDPDLRIKHTDSTGIDCQSFMVKINTNSYAPMFEKKSSVIATTNGGVRKSDIAIIALTSGSSIIAKIHKLSSHIVEIISLEESNETHSIILNKDILWMARILYKEL